MVEGMSVRETSRVFSLHRDTVRKMLAYSVPPGYRRQTPPRRPQLDPYTGVIDRILDDNHRVPRKQCHTAKRIFTAISSANRPGRWNWPAANTSSAARMSSPSATAAPARPPRSPGAGLGSLPARDVGGLYYHRRHSRQNATS